MCLDKQLYPSQFYLKVKKNNTREHHILRMLIKVPEKEEKKVVKLFPIMLFKLILKLET